MEEVIGSIPIRSTKSFQAFSRSPPKPFARILPANSAQYAGFAGCATHKYCAVYYLRLELFHGMEEVIGSRGRDGSTEKDQDGTISVADLIWQQAVAKLSTLVGKSSPWSS